jgi:hypothetical protein
MFKPIKGGTSLVVGVEDLAVNVYLPPIGYVWNYHTNELEPTAIICRSSIVEEQYWEKPKWPSDYNKKARREKEIQKTDPEYFDPELKEYRAREWHRRLYGAWFMNNGKPTYITGLYYFYLAHWIIDIGSPEFRIADLEKAYFWDYCVEDPLCYGMVEMTKRRAGKTYFGSCILYEYTSRTSNAHAGIQSKTGPDARLVFSEKLIQPWRKLIDFFRPDYDQSKGDVPKTELRFFKTSKKGSKVSEEYNEGTELESWIDFYNSGSHAADGQKFKRYMRDEVFKTIEADIIVSHRVIKPCLEDTSGNIIGKGLYTSTVEEMEGFLDKYIKLWEDSDMTKRDKNGKTKSGLYRWFTPAQKLMHVDKYGYPEVKRALQEIENTIASYDDPREISDFIRKNPRNWKEAFKAGGDNCLFDPLKIEDRLSTLFFKKDDELYDRYNLIWENEDQKELKKVKLVKSRNGRFRFIKGFEKLFIGNDVHRRGSQFLPKNQLRFVIGVDPYDHNRTKDGKFSMGAAAIFMKYDPLLPETSENFIGYYLGRPAQSAIFYDDILKLCHYLSCQMLYEDNKPKIGDHFIDQGYGAFLVRDEKGHPGISGSTKTHQVIAEHIEAFIDEHCHRVEFVDMLNDWLKLDLEDTTKFDLGMATGYALIAASKIQRKEKLLNKLKNTSPSGLVRKYRIRTTYAKRTSIKFS